MIFNWIYKMCAKYRKWFSARFDRLMAIQNIPGPYSYQSLKRVWWIILFSIDIFCERYREWHKDRFHRRVAKKNIPKPVSAEDIEAQQWAMECMRKEIDSKVRIEASLILSMFRWASEIEDMPLEKFITLHRVAD